MNEKEKAQESQESNEGKEEEKAKKKPEEKPTPNTDKGNKPESTSLVEAARNEREKLETTIENMKKQNDRTESLMAEQELSGKGMAGQTPHEKTEDEKWAEDAKVRYEGTGLDPTEDNTETKYI